MAARSTERTTLRVGVVRDGSLCAQLEVPAGHAAGFVEDALVLLPPDDPRAVFVHESSGVRLEVVDGMRGTLRRSGKKADLRSGPLDVGDRGRLRLGALGLVFAVECDVPPGRFPAPWLDLDDAPFLGFVGLFGLLATVFALGIVLAPPPPDPGWTHLVMRGPAVVLPTDPVEPEVEPEPVVVEPEAHIQRVVVREPEPEAQGETPSHQERDRRRREAALRAQRVRDGMSARLRSAGDAHDEADLDLLAQATTTVDTGPELDVLRSKFRGPSEDHRLGDDLHVGQIGVADGPGAPPPTGAPETPPTVDPPCASGGCFPDDAPVMEDGGQLPPALQARFRTCYEVALRTHPGLSGRIEIAAVVRDSRVVEVDLLDDSLAVADVGACAVAATRRWRALRFDDGPVGPWSVVFRPR